MFATRTHYICSKNRLSIFLRNFRIDVTVRRSDHPPAAHDNQYEILHFLAIVREPSR